VLNIDITKPGTRLARFRMADSLAVLVSRFDPEVFSPARPEARIRLGGRGIEERDVILRNGTAELVPADGAEPHATITADAATWERIARDLRGGMDAFRRGRLVVRHDLHLGVGFLAATAGDLDAETRLRFVDVDTPTGRISTMQAGAGPPVLLLHGLGASKVSFLPTLAALAPHHRVIALDLPGFGDSAKPFGAPYHAPFFAQSVVDILDALHYDGADIVGNSMGGRVALELGLRDPECVRRIVLLAPSLAWLRERPWATFLRFLPPELGAIQPAPRPVVEAIVRRFVPGAAEGWTAAGVDEFLRSYLTPSGRAAFYAAARNIYLEEPHGEKGFWTRLPALEPPALFVWGRNDQLVPIRFAEHVRRALPHAQHVELDCGHVPQLEKPQAAHDAILRFLR
jgi:pimeloyl-ACP methyl ester carboxylesterase